MLRWRRARAGCCVRGVGGGGAISHLAEPVETTALRGKRRRAKTDREDAKWLRTLLGEGGLPGAWIPLAHVREWRTRARLRKTLVDERTTWLQRVQATLIRHGVSGVPDKLLSAKGREFLAGLELPEAARGADRGGASMVEALDRQLAPLEAELRRPPPDRLPGADAPLRDRRVDRSEDPLRARRRSRLSASRKAVRCAGSTSACTAPPPHSCRASHENPARSKKRLT
jgi:transposase